jgi:uncharacterized RDD family membrane protein YckC
MTSNQRNFNFDKNSWICPMCGLEANNYFCGNCGFKIYTDIRHRWASNFIDGLFLSFVSFPFIRIGKNYFSNFPLWLGLFEILFFCFYVVLVGLWGQTPGKMMTKTKILKLDGSRARWKNVLKRYSVELVFIVYAIFMFLVIWFLKTKNLLQLDEFHWMGTTLINGLHIFQWAYLLYLLSGVVVFLNNDKRRDLHDYIGGTVIVHDPGLSMRPWNIQVEN